MLYQGTIREVIEYFDPKDKTLWLQRQAPWLVATPPYRFKYCRVDEKMSPIAHDPYDFDRSHYFTTAWLIHRWQTQYDEFWHERYKLAKHCPTGKYATCNAEIDSRLGGSVMATLQNASRGMEKVFAADRPKPNSLVEFKDPDVVAYRKTGQFGFFEIKGEREGFQFLQLESLGILQTLVSGCDVAVVRMIPVGHRYTPVTHSYRFNLP